MVLEKIELIAAHGK